MIRTITTVITLLLLQTSTLFAQACGSGTFTLEIFQPSGEPAQEYSYEILPASMATTSGADPMHIQRGFVLHRSQIKDIADTLDQQRLNDRLVELGVKRQGKIVRGIIEFPTRELLHHPCILKITSGGTDLYILVNLFGGCDRNFPVLWHQQWPRICAW